MKAITLKDSPDPWATLIEYGIKTIETRTWSTKYRGDLLICASKSSKTPNAGKAVCVVEVYDCRPMTPADENAARCDIYPNAFSWRLRNLRWLSEKFSVTGQLSIYEVEIPEGIRIYRPGFKELLDHPDYL
ncbi:ASCH domain-containing protein [Spirosoma sordidisoli]|uniref:ASCH domain-containing protein n=1 Tax=Spirosoma sordidisoli TaxID=2502893 RepID=A0A4V1RWN0_9BACT|nr:ASCH domain-containing protein [Spirosoma sordidisoli]RYC70838.1 ASCH domain-containing protein [Spirosoma sordidisoli]